MRAKRILNERVAASQCGELTDKTISIRRVAKVVKGAAVSALVLL